MTLPLFSLPCNPVVAVDIPDICNPESNVISIPSFGSMPNDFYWYDALGILLQSDTGVTSADTIKSLLPGSYYVIINDSGVCGIDTLTIVIPDSLYFNVDSVSHTTCIGCDDGKIYFTMKGGTPPYNVQFPAGVRSGNSIVNLSANNYSVCVIDQNGCNTCRQAIILEDPTRVTSLDNNRDYFLSPNPVSGIATLYFEGGGKISVKLLNADGEFIKILLRENLNSGIHKFPVDCNGLANGSYILEITDNITEMKTFSSPGY